jgi:hypothetical protein
MSQQHLENGAKSLEHDSVLLDLVNPNYWHIENSKKSNSPILQRDDV